MRTSSLSRLGTLFIIVVLGTMLAAPRGVVAAPPEVFPVNDEFVAPFLTEQCGFEVLRRETGTIRVTRDADGNVLLARINVKITLIGPGGTLTYPDVGIDKLLAVEENGTTRIETVMATGILGIRVVVPGEGVVVANVGREIRTITFDTVTGEFISFDVSEDSGLNLAFDDDAIATICAALAA